jgi:hypothetical protein
MEKDLPEYKYLPNVEEAKRVYSRIKEEILLSLKDKIFENSNSLEIIKGVLSSIERYCLESSTPCDAKFWYEKSVSSLYAYGKLLSGAEKEGSEKIIDGIFVLSCPSSEYKEMILEGIKEKKSLEEKINSSAI